MPENCKVLNEEKIISIVLFDIQMSIIFTFKLKYLIYIITEDIAYSNIPCYLILLLFFITDNSTFDYLIFLKPVMN